MTGHENIRCKNKTQHQSNVLCRTVQGFCNQAVEVQCCEVLWYVVVCDLLYCVVLRGIVWWSHEVHGGVLCCHMVYSASFAMV